MTSRGITSCSWMTDAMTRRLPDEAVERHAARKLLEALRPLMELLPEGVTLAQLGSAGTTELRDAYALAARVFAERPSVETLER
jgi:hypothetical protein